MDPVICDSCAMRFSLGCLTEADYRTLQDQHYFRVFVTELRMLEKVKEFYQRHPEAEGRIKPHSSRAMDSSDPIVIEKLCAGIPFDQIVLPPEESALPLEFTEQEAEVVE